MKINYVYALFFGIVILFGSCKKQDNFLDEKPNQALSAISSLTDVQNLLNNERLFNLYISPGVAETSTDDYYLLYARYSAALGPQDQNAYIWAHTDIYPVNGGFFDWDQPYQAIYVANIALESLNKLTISAGQQQLANQLKGIALFDRAFSYYNLLQTYSLPYDSTKASSELGIPLRLTSDFNIKAPRESEATCYSQVLQDLQSALPLLPEKPQRFTQPAKITVNALLARIYNALGSYNKALVYANAALTENGTLTDYNTLTSDSTDFLFTTSDKYPLAEDIFHCTLNSPVASGVRGANVDSTLYSLYDDNDIRKSYFFVNFFGGIRFIGSYEFLNFGFEYCGLATDEMYLIRAESNARLGNVSSAMSDLNLLLKNRYKTGTLITRTASSADDALSQILIERRKELLYRGLRWTDLRRLNQDPRFAVTLKRVLNGVTYTLPPNDPRYAISIPWDEINQSGIPQNPR
jgi:starch-binding outer membrane protein, SusD/RagB family